MFTTFMAHAQKRQPDSLYGALTFAGYYSAPQRYRTTAYSRCIRYDYHKHLYIFLPVWPFKELSSIGSDSITLTVLLL